MQRFYGVCGNSAEFTEGWNIKVKLETRQTAFNGAADPGQLLRTGMGRAGSREHFTRPGAGSRSGKPHRLRGPAGLGGKSRLMRDEERNSKSCSILSCSTGTGTTESKARLPSEEAASL